MENREQHIIDIIKNIGTGSSKEIFEKSNMSMSYATLKRVLANMVRQNYLLMLGRGKATKYSLSSIYELLLPIDVNQYYQKEIDERKIKTRFNLSVITELLYQQSVFTEREKSWLNELHKKYQKNISKISDTEYKREMERLAIDLSWKSSQIEGNTYSLLETERLLKEKETAKGKTKEEAVMLLNHKEAIDFIVAHPDYLYPLTVAKIEDIHSILINELNIERNLRRRRVGISGTNYCPPDNEFHILEVLQEACKLINHTQYIFEKSLLAIVLISYIQPFIDGNKRTARIVGNAVLLNKEYCPLSFRTVDSVDYKKAMLLFYEQNNISAFKKIFMQQYEFAVNTYF